MGTSVSVRRLPNLENRHASSPFNEVMVDAVTQHLQKIAGGKALVEQWQKENGPFTEEELKAAREKRNHPEA